MTYHDLLWTIMDYYDLLWLTIDYYDLLCTLEVHKVEQVVAWVRLGHVVTMVHGPWLRLAPWTHDSPWTHLPHSSTPATI